MPSTKRTNTVVSGPDPLFLSLVHHIGSGIPWVTYGLKAGVEDVNGEQEDDDRTLALAAMIDFPEASRSHAFSEEFSSPEKAWLREAKAFPGDAGAAGGAAYAGVKYFSQKKTLQQPQVAEDQLNISQKGFVLCIVMELLFKMVECTQWNRESFCTLFPPLSLQTYMMCEVANDT